MQAAHSTQPALIIVGLPANIFGYLGVRKYQESFRGETLHNHLRELVRFERRIAQECSDTGMGCPG